MKKHILLLGSLSIVWIPFTQACTFTVLNNSPYEEIFLSNKEHLADIVSRETLMEIHAQASREKSKNIEQHVQDAVRISKVMRTNPRGQIVGQWFDIYVPYQVLPKSSKKGSSGKTIAGQFKKAYRVAIRYCGEDNYLTYSNIKKGYATKSEKTRRDDKQDNRYEIIDFSKPEQATRAHELISSHDQIPQQTQKQKVQMGSKSKKHTEKQKAFVTQSKAAKTKKRKFVDQFEGEQLTKTKKVRAKDQKFFEDTTFIGSDPEKFEGTLP